MKKRFLGILAMLAVLCIALVGCGGGGGADYSANFQGEWELVAIEGENEMTEEDLQLMKDLDLVVTLTLAEDGTADLVMFDEPYGEGTWKATGETTCDITLEDELIESTLDTSTGRLSLTQGGDSLVFVRAE